MADPCPLLPPQGLLNILLQRERALVSATLDVPAVLSVGLHINSLTSCPSRPFSLRRCGIDAAP